MVLVFGVVGVLLVLGGLVLLVLAVLLVLVLAALLVFVLGIVEIAVVHNYHLTQDSMPRFFPNYTAGKFFSKSVPFYHTLCYNVHEL